MKVFKIRNTKTGLFSTGGGTPKWTHFGKTWTRLSFVKSHLSQFGGNYRDGLVYKDAEIVEADITELLTPLEPVSNYLNEKYDQEIAYYEDRVKNLPNDTYYQRQLEMVRGRKALLNDPS